MAVVKRFSGGSITFLKGKYGNSRRAYKVSSGFDRGIHKLPPRGEYWLDYSVMPEDGWIEGMGGKLLGLSARDVVSGGRKSTPHGWSSRIMWGDWLGLRSYLYHQNRSWKWGDNKEFPGQDKLRVGRWTRITHRIKVNDPGKKNAEIEFWLNGKKVLAVRGVALRGQVSRTSGLIEKAFFTPIRGGGSDKWAVKRDTTLHFRDIEVLDKRPDFGSGAKPVAEKVRIIEVKGGIRIEIPDGLIERK